MASPKLRFKEFDNDWINTKVKDLGEFSSGGTPSKDIHDYWNGNIPWISSSDLNEESIFDIRINRFISEDAIKNSATKKIPKNSILLVSRVGVGKVALTNQELCTSQDFTALTPKKDYALFIAYLMKNITPRLLDLNQGTSIKGFVREDLISLPISLPSKEEQTKIASFLSAVDEKISQLTQKHELLSQYKQGMMQKLFSQQLRFKADDGSEFGEWENSYIGNECKITTGNKDTQNKVDDGLYPFFVRSQTVEKINSYSMDCEAILTSGDGVGVGKNYHYMNGKFDFHQRVYCLYEFSERLIGRYLYIYFSNYFYDRVKRLSAKNSVDSVRMDMISKMEIKLPCLEEQTKIANF